MENDTLQSLVISLSSTEKADFKKLIRYNSGKRIPDYEVLYDIYNKLSKEHLSTEAFQIKLEKYLNKKPSIKNNLPNVRMQMKERLLQSLVIGQAAKNSKQMMRNLICEVEVLVNRKLYAEASIKLKQSKKHAATFDLNNLLAEIIDLEIFLLTKRSTKYDNVYLEKLIDEQSQYSNLYNLEIALKNIYCKMTLMAERDMQMSKEASKTKLKALINDSKLLNLEIEAHKKQHKVHIVMWFYRINNLYYRSIGENERAYQNSKNLVSYFESDEQLLKHFESEYIAAICGYTRTSFHYNKIKELAISIDKVQRLYKLKKNFETLEATCDMGILCYLRSHQYEKAVDISNLMNEIWNELELKIEDGKLLWYTHTNSILHWVNANAAALKIWLNRGLAIARSNKGRAFYFGIRMLDLMSDLDNQQLFSFIEKLETLQKTLLNNEHLTGFQKIVLQHFRAFYNIEFSSKNINLNKKEKKDLVNANFKSLKASLLNLQYKTAPINYGEVMLWCESHLQGKTIKQVFEAQG